MTDKKKLSEDPIMDALLEKLRNATTAEESLAAVEALEMESSLRFGSAAGLDEPGRLADALGVGRMLRHADDVGFEIDQLTLNPDYRRKR